MCGIAGFIDFGRRSSVRILTCMTDELHHRGPDDSGYYYDNFPEAQVGLGHRRLSILDLSSHGHQPAVLSHLTMTYNGEIYNFEEIRSDLMREGYSFKSDSDTEVILAAYHRWGIEAVNRFNGMFAIAIFDSQKRKLTLIRDRAGVKPVYWYEEAGLFMFASELKSFHQHPSFNKQLDYAGLTLYLRYGYIPEPATIFQNTHKLNAGHYLELNLSSATKSLQKYWDVADCYNQPKLRISENDAVEETERLLKSACEYRMVSDVPVGIFLSGGYDSSAVTALLQSERAEKLKTFSIGFHDERYNEAPHAKKIAEYIGTDHKEYYCSQKDAEEIIPRLPEIWDEPFSDNSVIPTILVSKFAKNDVKVSLSADGGDELFGGYGKYIRAQQYYDRISRLPFRKSIARALSRLPAESSILNGVFTNFSGRFHRGLSLMHADSVVGVMENLQKVFSDGEISEISEFAHEYRPTAFDAESLLEVGLPALDKMMAIDFKSYQMDNILPKVDRATMSVSLEGREPLLDHRLVSFIARLDPDLKVNNGTQKYLLKKIVHRYLPEKIMDRPKMGFSAPLVDWLRDDLTNYLETYLCKSYLDRQGLFRSDKIVMMKEEYLRGAKHHISKLWCLLIFQLWYDRWMK